jgi:gamma-F420-2:alpha-L-glutamate ligase
LFASQDGLEQILYEGQKVELPDCILVRTGAKVTSYGLAVIRQFEKMGVIVLNGFASIDISRDKLYTMQTLASVGIPIPRTCIGNFPLRVWFSFSLSLSSSSSAAAFPIFLLIFFFPLFLPFHSFRLMFWRKNSSIP